MRQRDIVLIPFPFSDQSGAKVRPALVLSNNHFNQTSADVVVCAITSTLKQDGYSLGIDQKDLETGHLYERSMIKVETLLKIQQSLIVKTIATVQKPVFSKVVAMLVDLVKPAN